MKSFATPHYFFTKALKSLHVAYEGNNERGRAVLEHKYAGQGRACPYWPMNTWALCSAREEHFHVSLCPLHLQIIRCNATKFWDPCVNPEGRGLCLSVLLAGVQNTQNLCHWPPQDGVSFEESGHCENSRGFYHQDLDQQRNQCKSRGNDWLENYATHCVRPGPTSQSFTWWSQ